MDTMITIKTKDLCKALRHVKIKIQDSYPILDHCKIIVRDEHLIVQTVNYKTKEVNQSEAIKINYGHGVQWSICAPMVHRYEHINPYKRLGENKTKRIGYPLLDYIENIDSEVIALEIDKESRLLNITISQEGYKSKTSIKCLDALEFPYDGIL